MRRDDEGNLMVLEAIFVAMILFTAIALSATFRLPTSASTFANAELEQIGNDVLRTLGGKSPQPGDQCHEVPCPFLDGSELERLISLALGYRGATLSAGEDPDSALLLDLLDQALPDGVGYYVELSNGKAPLRVAPLDREAPALDVVVAHWILSPNWTHNRDALDETVVVNPGETTRFGTPTVIRDALNRDANITGGSLATAFQEVIPANATLGTYQVWYGADRYNVTVMPPGVHGAGSILQLGDEIPTTDLVTVGPFSSAVHYNDFDGGGFEADDPLYLDIGAASDTVGVGDLRISPNPDCAVLSTCLAGRLVVAGDSDIGRAIIPIGAATFNIRAWDEDGDGLHDMDEPVYLGDADTVLETTEQRLSRVGPHPIGSPYELGQPGEDATNLDLLFTGAQVVFHDTDADGVLDANETAFLDLSGAGNPPGLSRGDIRLTNQGEPTHRGIYDVRLVVWYGI